MSDPHTDRSTHISVENSIAVDGEIFILGEETNDMPAQVEIKFLGGQGWNLLSERAAGPTYMQHHSSQRGYASANSSSIGHRSVAVLVADRPATYFFSAAPVPFT
jgi:hypothetical protein